MTNATNDTPAMPNRAERRKAKAKGATIAQLNGVYSSARAERAARLEIIRIVKEAHKQGRDLSGLQERFLIGRTIDTVPAIKRMKLNTLEAETMDWQSILPLWHAEAGRANPDADPKSKATKAKGGLRSPEFHRNFRNAETAWSAIKRDAGAMDEAEGEGRRSGAGKGRPQGTTGGAQSQVNAGKTPDAGNVPPNPAPTPDKADTPTPEPTPEPTPVPVVAKATSNLDAARFVAGRVAELMAFAEENATIFPSGLEGPLATFAKEAQLILASLEKARKRK